MITKEQFQAMSDVEVNKVLTKLATGYGLPASCCLDYCNTPNDIMPLAFEHGISLIKEEYATEWSAFAGLYVYLEDWQWKSNYKDANPLRAIACCLILVLQEKQK